MHGTEMWEEVLCGKEETGKNSLGHGREKQRREVAICSMVGTGSGGVPWVPPRPGAG